MQEDQFNGKLYSLVYLCDKHGLDIFAYKNGFLLNRVVKLYNSNLSGNINVEDLLSCDNFEDEFINLQYQDKIFKKKSSELERRRDEYIENYYSKCNNFCNIGMEELISLLPNLQGDYSLSCFYILCIEKINVQAKQSIGYSQIYYDQKENLILKLIECAKELNINYGISKSDIIGIKNVIYFDFPFGQFSWHTNLVGIKDYNSKWDELINSHLVKIENFVSNNYKLTV